METSKSLFLFLALFIWALPACENDKPKDSEKMADKANEVKTETGHTEEDSELLVSAVSSDYFEVALADQAATMATHPSVKEFASMMKTAHQTMMAETRALAAQKGYTVPTTMSNDYMEKVNDMAKLKKGKEYDMKYVDDQLEHHQKILDNIEKRMADTKDAGIKMWTEKASAVVRKHIQMAKDLDTQLEKIYK